VWFKTDESLVLSGSLEFPDGPAPFPAVVLMHGCSGFVSRSVDGWRRAVRSWGYATFVVDSFSGRGFSEVCSDALALTPNLRIADAYGALAILATHPRIDARRIALMGFSHGGAVTLGAATEWARQTYVAAGGATFRAFLPFYPYCNAVVPEVLALSAPLRIHIGEMDDWTPAASCRTLVEELRDRGADAEIAVYAGALHSFDNLGVPVTYARSVDNAAACTPRLASMRGRILNLEELKACIRKGATVGFSAKATEEARVKVRAQLGELLR
jgi:dienelactone hydrolase